MIRRIPQNHRWTGPYQGSYYGDLWKTFSVDLDRNEGMIGLSQRLIKSTSTGLSSAARAFVRTDADCEDRYWGLSADELVKTDSSANADPTLDWDADGLSGSPDSPLDLTIIGNDSRNDSGRNKLFVTLDSGDIAVLNDTGNNVWTASWWETKHSQPPMDSSINYHPIEYFPQTKIGIVGDGNLVHTISRPSDTQNDTLTNSRLILPKDLVIRHIFTTAERAWFCCYNRKNEGGAVVEWDGFSQSPNQIHKTQSAVLTGQNIAGAPTVITNTGAILEFSGNAFVPTYRNGQKVAFPMHFESDNFFDTVGSHLSTTRVAPRCMAQAHNGLVYLNIDGPSTPSFQQSAGVWCLNPISGRLYNKFSFTASTGGDTTDDTSYGMQTISQPGGIYMLEGTGDLISFIAGASTFDTNASVANHDIFRLEDADSITNVSDVNHGYFITQYIHADRIKELYDTLWIRFNRFRFSSGKIVIKARGGVPLRGRDYLRLNKTITWTSTTTFTVTFLSADDSIAVGDEVEVYGGANSGWLAHITAISGAHGALQTVTIDETVDLGSNTSYASFDRWKKLGTITDTSIYEKMLNIGIDSSFVQFKVEMRGSHRDMKTSDLTIVSKPSIQLEN